VIPDTMADVMQSSMYVYSVYDLYPRLDNSRQVCLLGSFSYWFLSVEAGRHLPMGDRSIWQEHLTLGGAPLPCPAAAPHLVSSLFLFGWILIGSVDLNDCHVSLVLMSHYLVIFSWSCKNLLLCFSVADAEPKSGL